MKLIPLKNHYEFMYVDDEDYEELSKHTWHLANYNYAARPLTGESGKRVYTHRYVMGLNENDGLMLDHIDMNKLNNQKNNLRISNKALNSANRGKQKGEYTSKYKGVCLMKYKNGKLRKEPAWRAYIVVGDRQKSLGVFSNETDAAKAYDKAALKHFGEHARFNFPKFFVPSIEEE